MFLFLLGIVVGIYIYANFEGPIGKFKKCLKFKKKGVQIVKFNNGSYGVRKYDGFLTYYSYLGLMDGGGTTWYSADSLISKYCQGTRQDCENALKKVVTDKGTPVDD